MSTLSFGEADPRTKNGNSRWRSPRPEEIFDICAIKVGTLDSLVVRIRPVYLPTFHIHGDTPLPLQSCRDKVFDVCSIQICLFDYTWDVIGPVDFSAASIHSDIVWNIQSSCDNILNVCPVKVCALNFPRLFERKHDTIP